MKKILMIACIILLFSSGCSGPNAAKAGASSDQTHCDSSMPDFSGTEQASTVSGSGCVPVDPAVVPGVSEPDVPSSFEASKETGSAVASTEPILTGKLTGSGLQRTSEGKNSHKAPTDQDTHKIPTKSKPGEALAKSKPDEALTKSKPLIPPDTTKQPAAAVDTAVEEARCELTAVFQDNSKTLTRYVNAKASGLVALFGLEDVMNDIKTAADSAAQKTSQCESLVQSCSDEKVLRRCYEESEKIRLRLEDCSVKIKAAKRSGDIDALRPALDDLLAVIKEDSERMDQYEKELKG